MRRWAPYVVGAVLLAGLLGAAGRKWLFVPEWRRYQREYKKMMEDVYGRPIQIPEGIQELGSPKVGRADRCLTCHLGVDEPLLEGTQLRNPFGPHPILHHSFEEFGCTICHLGDGTATTAGDAHENPGYPQYRMLPVQFTEAGCGKCHRTRVVKDAWDLSAGRGLLKHYGCHGCHWIPGFEGEKNAGYDLTGIGSKVNRRWLVSWLRDPRGYSASSTMPSFKLSDSEIQFLADFLLSSTTAEVDQIAHEVRGSSSQWNRDELIERGIAEVSRSECLSCHAVNGKGGRLGPDLGKIGSKVRKEWMFAWLKVPAGYFPETIMPRFSFPNAEIESIAEYLMARMVDPQAPAEEMKLLNTPAESIPESNIAEGRKLFVQYGCYGCHQVKGLENLKKGIGPALGGVGSKDPDDLDFGKSTIPRTLADYVYHKLKKPDLFSDVLMMPDFHLSDLEARQMTLALLSLSGETVPERLVFRETSHPAFKPIGEFGKIVEEYQCLDCHQVQGSGNPLGPDLSMAGSKLRREWLTSYLKTPYPIRPLQTEKMPVFGLSDEEITSVVDYFERYLTSEMIPDDLFSSPDPPISLVEEGEKLFYAEYGCHACHIVGSRGGIYGPSLHGAGDRLESGWVYAWLRNPWAINPSTIIPDFGIPPEHAKALAAFVMSQKNGETSLDVGFHQVQTPEEAPIPEQMTGVRRYRATKGRAIYFRYCVFCHGAGGEGNGSNAASLEVRPASFTDVKTMAARSNEDLRRIVQEGGKAVGQSVQMPPYGRRLTSVEVDDVIFYIRTYIPLVELSRERRSQAEEARAGG